MHRPRPGRARGHQLSHQKGEPMNRSRLAWSLATLDTRSFSSPALVVDPSPDYVAVAVYAIGITSFVAVGALLVTRVPANPIGPLLLAAGTFAVASSALWSYANLGTLQTPTLPGWALARSFGDAFFIYPIVIALVDIPLVFPDGRLPSRRFRWVVLASIVLLVGWAIGAFTQTGAIGLIVLLSMLVSFGGAAIAVALRFRRGDPVQRQQVKGLAAAVLVAVVFFPTGFLVWNESPGLSDALVGVGLLALFALPVVIGLAILRYRLYDIDRIISRTISYAVVIGLLAATFALAIILLQTALARFTGGQTIAVAASTLAVFVLFQPVMRRVRRAVDRRFDRARYDAERTAAAFSERLRDQVDMETVTTDLRATVAGAIAPTVLGVWLRPRGTGR